MIAGAGQRLLDGIDTTYLELLKTTTFASGIVVHVYEPRDATAGNRRALITVAFRAQADFDRSSKADPRSEAIRPARGDDLTDGQEIALGSNPRRCRL